VAVAALGRSGAGKDPASARCRPCIHPACARWRPGSATASPRFAARWRRRRIGMASQLGLCYVPPVATAAGVFDMVERRASDSDAAAPAGVRRASAGDRENRL